MSPRKRDYFDKQVQRVLDRLPRRIHKILETVPLHIEDRPSRRVREHFGIRGPRGLLGYYSGVPLDTMFRHSSGIPNMITIYREGIFQISLNENGRIDPMQLREQIRKTILHELGHYHGMDEDELTEIGYG